MFGFVRNFLAARRNRHNRLIVVQALMSSKYEFRSKSALARKIGTTDLAVVDGILATIGVRAMFGNPDMVGLTDRIGTRARRLA